MQHLNVILDGSSKIGYIFAMPNAYLTLGVLLNKELKHAVYVSKTWKLAHIAWQSDPLGPKIVRFKDHEYVTLKLHSSQSSFVEIQNASRALKQELLKHLPDLDEKELKVYILPQVLQ